MRVMSWNVQGVFPQKPYEEKISDQIEFLCSLEPMPDVLLLQEVSRYASDLWRSQLREEAGYREIVDSLDWAQELSESTVPPHHQIGHSNGNLTAVRDPGSIDLVRPSIKDPPFGETDLKHFDTNFPEKILSSVVEWRDFEVEVWNVRAVPGSTWGEEKVKILQTVYNRLIADGQRRRIITGDLNSPDRELADGQAVPFGYEKDRDIWQRYVDTELHILKGLGTLGIVDVFRSLAGYGDLEVLDVSYATGTDNPLAVHPGDVEGKRFDHVLASADLNPTNCEYDVRGFEHSDHAPIVADFAP